MGSITTIYFNKDFEAKLEQLKEYAKVRNFKGLSPLIQHILSEWLEQNRKYVETKITDFKVEQAIAPKHRGWICPHCHYDFKLEDKEYHLEVAHQIKYILEIKKGD